MGRADRRRSRESDGTQRKNYFASYSNIYKLMKVVGGGGRGGGKKKYSWEVLYTIAFHKCGEYIIMGKNMFRVQEKRKTPESPYI